MTYENVKLFRDIAQSHSFSRAAVMNGVSQSAASQHVQELEGSLGVELLDRSTRPLTVTPAGKLYLEFCRDILRRPDQLSPGAARYHGDLVARGRDGLGRGARASARLARGVDRAARVERRGFRQL